MDKTGTSEASTPNKLTPEEFSGTTADSDAQSWARLDGEVLAGWDADVHGATEVEIGGAAHDSVGLQFLPFPYVTPGGSEGTFRHKFAWDTHFINLALLAHERLDLVRGHLLNDLFMIERYGYVPNANVDGALTRSQTPVFPDGLWRYYLASDDLDFLYRAYPLLKLEFEHYWNGDHHRTHTGLATNRDLGDSALPPELAAEAETGLDWTPIFDGDVRRCAPLITNCALVRYAWVLSWIAERVSRPAEAAAYAREAEARSELIAQHCWNETTGFFHEFDYVSGRQLPYVSACAYWPMWAGVASDAQAKRLVANLATLEQIYGIASTDQAYPDSRPRSAYAALAGEQSGESMVDGAGQLQWRYPAGWPPEQLVVVEALDHYGYHHDAIRIARRFLSLIIDQYEKTGKLWEKYNVVDGGLNLPNSRYGNQPMHGWTATAVALLGRRVHHNEPLSELSPWCGHFPSCRQ